MKYYLILIIFLFHLGMALGQNNPEDKTGSWFSYSGTHQISEKISINSYVQTWLYEVGHNFDFLLLTTGINYHVSNALTTTISYGYADIDSGFKTNTAHTFENRLYEQIGYKHKIFELPVDHRFRAEQRFLNRPTGNQTQHRLRYRIGTKIKLNNRFFIRLNNEFLATIQKNIVTENRLYSALGFNISKSSNLQLGYLNRKINGLNLHRLQACYAIKTNHIKKKNGKASI